MDIEQLKQDFLEEISSPLEMLLSDTRQRMSGILSVKDYNKIDIIKRVLMELERVINHYKEAGLPGDFMSKMFATIKPVLTIGKETELLDIDKILVGIIKQLNTARGIKTNLDPSTHNEDDILAFKDELWDAFKICPTDDYELLKKSMKGEVSHVVLDTTWRKVIGPIRKAHDKETDPPIADYINTSLYHIFDALWDEDFRFKAVADMQKEREHASGKLKGVKESIRAAMLDKLMP